MLIYEHAETRSLTPQQADNEVLPLIYVGAGWSKYYIFLL